MELFRTLEGAVQRGPDGAPTCGAGQRRAVGTVTPTRAMVTLPHRTPGPWKVPHVPQNYKRVCDSHFALEEFLHL